MSRKALQLFMKRHKAKGATTPTLMETNGYFDENGMWVVPQKVEEPTPIDCAILPMRMSVIQGSNGHYTARDREIYSYAPLVEKQQITYKNTTYQVDAEMDYSDYSGVFVYTAKQVSVHVEN